jgi:type I restriction enzyme S subunit
VNVITWPRVKVESIKADQRHSLVGGPFGSELTTRDYVEEGVPVIRGVNLPDDRCFSENEFVYVREEKADQLIANNAHPGDVVFTQRGTLGQVGLIPMESRFPRYVISQSQMKLTVSPDKADARFVYYYFRHPETIQIIKNHALTSGVPHINLGLLREFQIPLPPVEEQQKIVATLSAYDDLIENNRRRMALLEEAARLLYREWFVRLRFPGHEHTHIVEGVPEGWRKATAFEAMQVMSGGTPKTTTSDFWGDEIPFYTPKDSVPECYVLDTEKHLTELGLNNCNSKLYPKDTIFITARGTVGNLNLAQRPMAMNQSCYALVGRDGIPQKFLFCAMREAIQHFRQHAVGAVFDAIIVDTFKLIPIVNPNSKLIRPFEEKIDPMFAQIENLLQQNQRLRSARDLLLPRLMSGKIEV